MAGHADWSVWCLMDGRPGHENQTRGIVDALSARFSVRVSIVPLKVRKAWRKRFVRSIVDKMPIMMGDSMLGFAYDIRLPEGRPDIVIASGGDTQAALVLIGNRFRVPTVYSGHPKGIADDVFARVVTVTPRAGANNLLLPLPPVPRIRRRDGHAADNSSLIACLVGGETAGVRYSDADWRALAAQMTASVSGTGMRLLLTTSRRTGSHAESILREAIPEALVEEAVWWSENPTPVITSFLARARCVIVTEDSLSMVAESIYSGLPVLTVLPRGGVHTARDEAAMQGYATRGFVRRLRVGQPIPPLDHPAPTAPSWETVAESICDSIAPLCEGAVSRWRGRRVLVWGRTGAYGPDYPRNRVIEAALRGLGIIIDHYRPRISVLADAEYLLSGAAVPDVIWVPCFRYRDVTAAGRAARRLGIPLIFDPLISAWEKKIHERQRYSERSFVSRRLLAKERKQMSIPDVVVADTSGHADYFSRHSGVDPAALSIVPVGAEQPLFAAQPFPALDVDDGVIEWVWFGSFIDLHGLDVLAEAIATWSRMSDVPGTRWRFLGDGPLREGIERDLSAIASPRCDIRFEPWGPLEKLPARLASAHVILGIFDAGAKSGRVIPNKVYQGLALGRPVLTAGTAAYSAEIRQAASAGGLLFCAPGQSADLVRAAKDLTTDLRRLPHHGHMARQLYEKWCSPAAIQEAVLGTLDLARQRHSQRIPRGMHAR